jgi:outer membrane protein assembly factor BamB
MRIAPFVRGKGGETNRMISSMHLNAVKILLPLALLCFWLSCAPESSTESRAPESSGSINFLRVASFAFMWDIAVDSSGCLCVVGEFERSGIINVYSPEGSLIYAKSMHSKLGRNGTLEPRKVALDESGNIFVLGFSDRGIVIDNSTVLDAQEDSHWDWQPFLTKFAHDGEFLWAKTLEFPVDTIFGPFIDDTMDLRVVDSRCILVLCNNKLWRFDADGNSEWSRDFVANAIAANNEEYIYFGSDSGTFGCVGADNDVRWRTELQNFRITAIDINRDSEVAITGYFKSPIRLDSDILAPVFDPAGEGLSIVLKCSGDGVLRWANKLRGGTPSDILIDGDGNVYAAGDYSSIASIQEGSNSPDYTWQADPDVFVVGYDSEGVRKLFYTCGDDGTDFGFAIAGYKGKDIYVTGAFERIETTDLLTIRSN